MHALTRLALPTVALAGALFAATSAEAKPNITRKGGQFGITLGGSVCMPGEAKCKRSLHDPDITVDGKTRPSFGLGAELGYRFKPWIYAGAAYNLGFFDTQYEVQGVGGFKRAYQNSVYGIVKPILPVWRFDFGLGMGPGFSRQAFIISGGDKQYSQGFSWVFSPSIDVFVSRRIFLGVKADVLLNGHNKVCHEVGDTTSCTKDPQNRDLAPVHQLIFGLHVGGTFL
ncbi:MAG: hypothetical protein IPN32_29885 [Deltaproteobacteria bacterium]|nr:hypothetical protein [Deltaproteobacteria bacterium]